MRLNGPILRVAGVAWLGSAVAASVAMQAHEMTPSTAGAPAATRPRSSPRATGPGRANLIFAAHPRCPCTRAGLGELSRIMAKCRGLVIPHVLFVVPGPSEQDWRRSELWRLASEVPDVRLVVDEGGVEAESLGLSTSGQVLLHDPDGRLLFLGGITGSRGHHGDNPGHDAVVDLLRRRRSARSTAPVFGCPILPAHRMGGRSPSVM